MFSLATIRQAATASVRQSAILGRASPLAMRRLYATENTEKPKEEEKAAAEKTEEDGAKDDLTKQLAEKVKKIAELQDAYLRCLADQENIRERSRKEVLSSKEFAIQKFAKDLLDTVDILGMALSAVPLELREKNEKPNKEVIHDVERVLDQLSNLYKGVSMTETELLKTLKRHGKPEGETFDPNRHQALFQAPMADKEAGTVFSVQKKGYSLKGRVLRPAQVGVVSDPQ
ncbi:GrpE-domain-containing protein [Phycomyces nitens]|nr:GrpE-domain-containing protein [Phycomyces nitens]